MTQRSDTEPVLEDKYMRYWGTIYHLYWYILGQTACPWADNGDFVYEKFLKLCSFVRTSVWSGLRAFDISGLPVVIAASVTAKIMYSWAGWSLAVANSQQFGWYAGF